MLPDVPITSMKFPAKKKIEPKSNYTFRANTSLQEMQGRGRGESVKLNHKDATNKIQSTGQATQFL